MASQALRDWFARTVTDPNLKLGLTLVAAVLLCLLSSSCDNPLPDEGSGAPLGALTTEAPPGAATPETSPGGGAGPSSLSEPGRYSYQDEDYGAGTTADEVQITYVQLVGKAADSERVRRLAQSCVLSAPTLADTETSSFCASPFGSVSAPLMGDQALVDSRKVTIIDRYGDFYEEVVAWTGADQRPIPISTKLPPGPACIVSESYDGKGNAPNSFMGGCNLGFSADDPVLPSDETTEAALVYAGTKVVHLGGTWPADRLAEMIEAVRKRGDYPKQFADGEVFDLAATINSLLVGGGPVFAPPATLKGTVVWSDGTPATGQGLIISDQTFSNPRALVSDEDGSFVLKYARVSEDPDMRAWAWTELCGCSHRVDGDEEGLLCKIPASLEREDVAALIGCGHRTDLGSEHSSSLPIGQSSDGAFARLANLDASALGQGFVSFGASGSGKLSFRARATADTYVHLMIYLVDGSPEVGHLVAVVDGEGEALFETELEAGETEIYRAYLTAGSQVLEPQGCPSLLLEKTFDEKVE